MKLGITCAVRRALCSQPSPGSATAWATALLTAATLLMPLARRPAAHALASTVTVPLAVP